MARIEKTVFVSYRRADVYTALAVYESLKNQGYDVFFDYRSISSGDFEQLIHSNIQARAHFVLILTPTALDRCNEPGDWLRREIEIAIDERRNIVPLFFKGFRFGTPSVVEKLTGSLQNLSRYNGLNVHEDFFDEAMHRLSAQYLSIPLETVLHPVSADVQKMVRADQIAADKALERREDVKKEPIQQPTLSPPWERPEDVLWRLRKRADLNTRLIGGIAGGLLMITFCICGVVNILNYMRSAAAEPTTTSQTIATRTVRPETTNTPSAGETLIPPTPPLSVGATMISDRDDMILMYVPAGEFMMGSDNGEADEKPAHRVNLASFWIDKTEVTNKMYSLCVSEDGCKQPRDIDHFTNEAYSNHPVIYISWNDATAYCSWASRRLPTEAEWEKAARGADTRAYPWGNEAPNSELLNYSNQIGMTTEVGSYQSGISPYGTYDMAGNVWEWVNDWYLETYYVNSPLFDPLGPKIGTNRVLRGGSWRNYNNNVSSSFRIAYPPEESYSNFGFRCAMNATQ